ncbi:MAG: dehydrogenase [Elusimicrobia bacterium]|nr:dehydrogenase [Elusimicrobiota bacterium]
MAKVHNWQINRDQYYKYEASPPKRQIGWVFDTNKCIACQTCTIACKTTWTSGKGQEYMFWNNVETKPFGFYPLAYDVKILDKLGPQKWEGKTYAGSTIFESGDDKEDIAGYIPEPEDWAHPNLGEDEVNRPIGEKATFEGTHKSWMFYLQRICNHCTYPACLAACPRQAIYKRKEDGIVLIDQARCRGYQKCVGACPYKKPMFNPNTGRSEKCISCYPLIEKGIAPRCVQTCIGKIRMAGFINPPEKADANNPIDYLVHVAKVALPLYPQMGTSPNVYYIPPIHVDTAYLKQMFGPGVDQAIATYKKREEKLVGLLSLFGSTEHLVDRFWVKDGQAAAILNGQEVVRVPVKEPIVFRVYKDEKHDVYRHSVT